MKCNKPHELDRMNHAARPPRVLARRRPDRAMPPPDPDGSWPDPLAELGHKASEVAGVGAAIGGAAGAIAASIAAVGTSFKLPVLGWVLAGPLAAALAGGLAGALAGALVGGLIGWTLPRSGMSRLEESLRIGAATAEWSGMPRLWRDRQESRGNPDRR